MHSPLVSVIITNYNYGRFLKRCIDSIIGQSYSNIELIICDNGSTDDSFSIIDEYLKIHPSKITFVRHRRNLGSANNFISGERLIQGDYFMNFGADDYLRPSFIETAVRIFSAFPRVSQIITHADIIDDDDIISSRASFFDGSYVIPGMSYAPILMVAGVTGHSSQTILSTAAHFDLQSRNGYIYSSMIGERTTAMMHATKYDVVFLNKPFVVCRESLNNETAKLNANLSQILEQWSLINAFAQHASLNEYEAIFSRRNEAIRKLGELASRLAADYYSQGNFEIAGRYLGLSMVLTGAFDNLLSHDPAFAERMSTMAEGFAATCKLNSTRSQIRQHSYAAPQGSARLDITTLKTYE